MRTVIKVDRDHMRTAFHCLSGSTRYSRLSWSLMLSPLLIVLQACAPQSSSKSTAEPVPEETTFSPSPTAGQAQNDGKMHFNQAFKVADAPSDHDVSGGPAQPPGPGGGSPAGTFDNKADSGSQRHPFCTDSYDPNTPQAPGLSCAKCERGQFVQPDPKKTKLDILFVADSSPSLEDTRAAIAAGVSKFVEALPPQTDYRFAVMPSHANTSYPGKTTSGLGGKLFVAGGEPAVLKGSDYPDFRSLGQLLTRKLVKVPLDPATDGGEAGLYSVHLGVSEPLLSENKRLGFFREDAALAIIFISDENDICSYDTDNYPAGIVPKDNPNKYTDNGKSISVEQKAADFFCKSGGAGSKPVITSHSVLSQLRGLKKNIDPKNPNATLPLIISGIVYTSADTVPTVPPANEPYPQYFKEKERGYGYLELMQENDPNFVAADLSKTNYGDGLHKIGQAAAIKLEVTSKFQLKEGAGIDPNTLCVMVDGKEVPPVADFNTRVDGHSYVFQNDTRQLQVRGVGSMNAQGGASKVDVFYCEPPTVISFNPELYSRLNMPTSSEHYRSLPVPNACRSVKAKISAGQLDGN